MNRDWSQQSAPQDELIELGVSKLVALIVLLSDTIATPYHNNMIVHRIHKLNLARPQPWQDPTVLA